MLKYRKEIFYLLNKKEKNGFIFLIFLMIINSLIEVLGITAIIPIISITLKNDLSLFQNFFFYKYIQELNLNKNFIIYSFSLVVFIFLLKNFFLIFYNWFLTNYYNNVGKRISEDIYQTYISLSYRDYLSLKTSKPIFDTTEGVEMFKVSLNNLSTFVLESIVVFAILAFLIFIDPFSSTLIFLILGVGTIIILYTFNSHNKFWGSEVKKNITNKINILNQTFSSFKDIKIYSCENFFQKKFKIFNEKLNKYQKIHLFFITLPKPIFEVMIVSILLLTLYFLIEIKNIPSEIIILNLAIYGVSFFRLYPSVYRISNCVQKAGYGSSALFDLINIDKMKLNNNSIQQNKFQKFNIKESIKKFTLENVSFSYEKDKRKIINDLSYTLENNYFYGIRGRTGVGKSTFLDIVSGLLMPDEGEIKINNKKINFLENNWFNKISYVTQNINLLDDTLENNIALAVNPSEIDKDKILKVIDSAELKNFDKSYSYDSNLILGERGIKISGGEKQRIGIARCLYFDRDIYIFDEATNALDSLTEIKILEKIKFFLKNKIVIVVSHKESTLKFCDKIIDIN